MDGRWLLLSLLVAAVAAVRWRRRAPRGEPPEAGATASSASSAPDGSAPTTSDPWAQARVDASLDAQLDRPAERRAPDPGDVGRDVGRGAGRGAGRSDGRSDDGQQPGQPNGFLGIEGLDAALDRVWAEHAAAADTLLDARLRLIVHRGIPARAIRPAPGTRTIRVVFADGTILLCRGTGQGDFGRLGLALQQHRSVRIGSFARAADGTRLEFRWHPDHRLAATAVGLDQPD